MGDGRFAVVHFCKVKAVAYECSDLCVRGQCSFRSDLLQHAAIVQGEDVSDTLSHLHFWGWQGIIVAAAVTLPLGITQSKEYAELEWPIDIAIAVVWLVIFGGNFLMTLINRRERHMYVALWFYIATIVTVALLHVFNNLVVQRLGSTATRSTQVCKMHSCSGGMGIMQLRSF